VFFLRRLRLALRYAALIDIMLGSMTRSGLAVTLRNKPELLTDDAVRAVDMMLDNARRDGNDLRADQLAALRKFLTDARSDGIEAALAAVPERGPLPFQDFATDSISLEAADRHVIAFLAIHDVAEAKNYIASRPVLLESEYDTLLATLAETYRRHDEMQGLITEHFRWLLQRCRAVGVDAALAERPHLFPYGSEVDDLEAQRRLASDLLGHEGGAALSGELMDQLETIPSDLQELLDEGTLAMMRFAKKNSLTDIDTAIAAWMRMLERPSLASAPAMFQFTLPNDIGTCFFLRYQVSGRSEDLDRSIKYLERAVEATPADFAERATYVSNLAAALRERAALKGESGA
jgi:hypothetical protein